VAVAAVLTTRDGIVDDLRLALGGVDGVPARFRELELAVRGAPAESVTYRTLAADVAAALDPQDDLQASAAYRRRLADVLVERALESAAERTG
jgi:aerobic carbon-monoxide dehydrogenase medium subunit